MMLTFGAMVLPAKVSLPQPPGKPGFGHKESAMNVSFALAQG